MLNKKTIAVKEDVKVLINRGMADMTPAELSTIQAAVNQVLVSRTLPGILSQIGRVYEVPFSDGRVSTAVILTFEGIKGLGIDLNAVFIGCGGKKTFNEATDVKNGVLVNLDLYQQVALLKAIIAIKSKLANVLGLYNLRGSRKVYEVLSREGIPRQLDIWWMWTADRFLPNQSEVNYPEEGIVTLPNLTTLKGYRFANRNIVNVNCYNLIPDYHNNNGVAIFGAQR